MSADRPRPAGAVLRGLALHAQPRTLSRPVRLQPVPPKAAAPAEPREPMPAETLESAREKGFAQGHAAGVAQERERVQLELEGLRARARDEGHAEGLRSGRDAAQAELNAALEASRLQVEGALQAHGERANSLMASATRELALLREHAEDDLLALVHEALCRLLGSHAVSPDTLRAMVRQLIAEFGARSQLRVHVHPDDHAMLLASSEGADAWQWVADAQVSLGGVLLKSPEGSLDARLETQLAALGKTLTAARTRALATLQRPPAESGE